MAKTPVRFTLNDAETALFVDEGANLIDVLRRGAGDLSPKQGCAAFMEEFAAQCGFCTSGMLMAAKALLDRQPSPSRDEVAEAISGNLCRCTGYEPIIDAVMRASQRMRGAA